MTDEKRRMYEEAVESIVERRICPACGQKIRDAGEMSGIGYMRGHHYCPTHGCVLGDCDSVPDGKGGWLNNNLCKLIGII